MIIFGLVVLLLASATYGSVKNSKLQEKCLELKIRLDAHPLRSFSDIKVGDNFEYHYYSSFRDGWFVDLYQLISLPDGKFQLVEIDKHNRVIGTSKMGIKNNLNEVSEYLIEQTFIRV